MRPYNFYPIFLLLCMQLLVLFAVTRKFSNKHLISDGVPWWPEGGGITPTLSFTSSGFTIMIVHSLGNLRTQSYNYSFLEQVVNCILCWIAQIWF